MTRDMRFGPQVLIETLPQVIITLAAWPMATWLRDYRALLWLLLARWCMTVLASHMLSERRYHWAFQRSFLGQASTFGWPLLVNGFLLFGITQGDRMVVGIGKTMSDLGTYSVAAQVTLIPGLMVASVLFSLLLPIMSRVQDNTNAFRAKYRLCAQVMAVFAAVFASFLSMAGGAIVTFAFGAKYAGCGPLITLLVAALALRLMRVAPNIAAMAKGDTQNMMFSNGARLVGVVLAAALVAAGGGLISVAVGGLCGEIVSYAVSATGIARRQAVSFADSARPAIVCAAPVALFATISLLYPGISNLWIGLPLGILAMMIALGVALLTLDDLRAEAQSLFFRFYRL
jgi:O-antigen/teichoic acid export membrane protein